MVIMLMPFIMPFGYLYALKRGEDKDFFQRLGFITLPETDSPSIWFHCASVGEVRSIKLITDMMKKDIPGLKVVVSTTSATGKAEAEKSIEPHTAFLLPLENPMAVAHIISYLNVKALIIVDTELWPNLIISAARHTRLFLLNGRMSDKSFKSYRRYRFLFGRMLRKFEHIYTKSDADTEKFAAVTGNINNVSTLGNIKFQTRKPAPEKNFFAFLDGLSIFAAASTHRGEEETAVKAFIESASQDRLVIAPRHKNRIQEAVETARSNGLTVSTLSENSRETQVIVVDRFGTLEELYSISEKIFVGGSMNGTGGHNIYEALQFRRHVCVGHNMSNFREIFELASKYHTVTVVKNSAEMAYYLRNGNNGADFDGLFAEMDSAQNNILNTVGGVIKSVYPS